MTTSLQSKCIIGLLIIAYLQFCRMKDLGSKQNKLAMQLRNNQKEIERLMEEYETLDAVIVSGSAVEDMDDWLEQPRKRRHAAEVKCDILDNTQTTDNSQHSQSVSGESLVSDAASEALGTAEFSDDFTGESEDSENEERSVDTRTGMPDSQLTDGTYDDQKEKKKKRRKKAKKAKKQSVKESKEKEGNTKKKRSSPPRSPSY